MKRGLVLEGGAMRGMFTAGVIDVMMENSIVYDGLIGVSAGAVFGCNYKSHQIGRAIRYNKRFCHDDRYCSLKSLLLTGDIYNGEFCYHDLPARFDPMDAWTFAHDPMKYYLVCTNADTGKAVYRQCDVINYENLEYMRASASMPLFAKPVHIDGMNLLDGGIADSIPLKWMEANGYDRNVLVLTRPRGYVKKPQAAMGLIAMNLRKFPAIVRRIKERHIDYNDVIDYIDKKEKAGSVFVIRPREALAIGRIEKDPLVLEKIYQEGRAAAKEQLSLLKDFLAE